MAKKGKTWRPPAQSRGAQTRRTRPDGPARATARTAPPDEERSERVEAEARPGTPDPGPPDGAGSQRTATVAPNRQARKDEARRPREELRRKAARRRVMGR